MGKFDLYKTADITSEANTWKWLSLLNKDLIEQLSGYQRLFQLDDLFQKEMHEREPSEGTISDINGEFENLVKSKEIFLSKSSIGRYIKNIDDKELAAYTLIAFHSEPNKEIEGVIRANLFKKGLRKDLLPEKQAFLNLKREMLGNLNKKVNELDELEQLVRKNWKESEQISIKQKTDIEQNLKNLSSEFNQKISELQNLINELIKAHQGDVEQSLESSKESISTHREKVKEELDNFLSAFKTEIKLKAPVLYWEENKSFHKDRSQKFARLIMIVSPVIFGMIAWAGWEVLSSAQVVWGKIGIIIFSTTLAIWLIRILVRMYLSHNHLEISSQEKIIMTKSYLALLAEGGASAPEERQMILQSIFKSSSTGIITDDGAPPSIIDLINKAGAK